MKQLLIFTIAVVLSGCEPTPEEQYKMKNNLPSGCSIQDLGSYGDVRHIVVVFCNGHKTTSTNYQQPSGKTSISEATVTIE